MLRKDARIYVAGHGGLVGSAIVRALRARGHTDLILRARAELDLTRQAAVEAFFAEQQPELVFLAAARVGGIIANSEHPAAFIRDNLLIQTNVIEAAARSGVAKLLFLGSSCIYPKLAPQPIQEEDLLTGALEPTNAPYAVAKIAGLTMLEAYAREGLLQGVCLMPTNLYGPGDNFDPRGSHVIPGLMRRLHEAKQEGRARVEVWGSGRPRREFLYVDDLADACLHMMAHRTSPAPINVGYGEDIPIGDLARMIAEVVGYRGELAFDAAKPDGTPRKLLAQQRLRAAGWRPKVGLREGLERTYRWYCAQATVRSAA